MFEIDEQFVAGRGIVVKDDGLAIATFRDRCDAELFVWAKSHVAKAAADAGGAADAPVFLVNADMPTRLVPAGEFTVGAPYPDDPRCHFGSGGGGSGGVGGVAEGSSGYSGAKPPPRVHIDLLDDGEVQISDHDHDALAEWGKKHGKFVKITLEDVRRPEK